MIPRLDELIKESSVRAFVCWQAKYEQVKRSPRDTLLHLKIRRFSELAHGISQENDQCLVISARRGPSGDVTDA